MNRQVLGIAGWKNSGKTTLTTKIIAELTRRGLNVASVKHAHHDADIDQEGSDTYRHRSAGAREVVLVTGARWALIHELGGADEPPLHEILEHLSPCDLVIVEGYKREPIAKIETRRLASTKSKPLSADDPNIIAIAADHPIDTTGLPTFDLEDVAGIADLIVAHFHLEERFSQSQPAN
jgi:molybdopterin-guanine dinucleotide biosynthesis adapter protein